VLPRLPSSFNGKGRREEGLGRGEGKGGKEEESREREGGGREMVEKGGAETPLPLANSWIRPCKVVASSCKNCR